MRTAAPNMSPAAPATTVRRDLLSPFLGKPVDVTTVDGKTWRGELREVGVYELALARPEGGIVVMKGAVVAVALAVRR